MKENAIFDKVVRFGQFEVDLRTSELRRQGRKIKLQVQQCRILGVLLERAGEVVTRDDLRKQLWSEDTFVDFDHSLNTAIMRLREALGDSSENPRFIETLPRLGYRFIAEVAELRDPALEKSQTAALSAPDLNILPSHYGHTTLAADIANTREKKVGLRQKLMLGGIVFAGVALIAGITIRSIQNTAAARVAPTELKSIVVLPLENLSGDKDQEYFADGMTDELIAHLAKIRALRVISRTSAMEYKGTHKTLSEIARDLKVDAVVEGTVLRSGNRVRITAELIQVATDRHLWAETYESELGDILALQGHVATAIVNEIRIKLTPEEEKRLATTRPVSTESYEDYLKGRYYWNKRSEQGLTKAIEYFQSATQKDPGYALAYAGLADVTASSDLRSLGRFRPKMWQAVRRQPL